MTVTYSNKSIYFATPQTNFALSYWVPRPIPTDNSDSYVKIESRHNFKPTAMSYDLYGTPAYWWTFNTLNMDVIQDPVRDFTTGTVIRVATLQRLQKLIG